MKGKKNNKERKEIRKKERRQVRHKVEGAE
jgi:hypothetical protein